MKTTEQLVRKCFFTWNMQYNYKGKRHDGVKFLARAARRFVKAEAEEKEKNDRRIKRLLGRI
jgi:hypothetical protein